MKALLAAAASVALLTGGAQAATGYATAHDWENNGTVGAQNDRDDETNALGAPDGDFLSLGLTEADGANPGFAVFGFGGLTYGEGSDVTAYEVTFNCTQAEDGSCTYPESLAVYYGTDYDFGSHDYSDLSDFTLAGEIFNGDAQGGASLLIPGSFTYIALVDTTLINFPNSPSTDGFDLDAIGVNPVPLPGAAALFVPALVAGGLARRKTKRS